MYELSICSNDGTVLRRFDLSRVVDAGRRVVVGRADDSDIRIKSGAVSRHHCAIERDSDEPDEWIIRDLGSTHGCTVDGQRVNEVVIKHGLVVSVGPAVLKFESAAAGVAARIRTELGAES